MKFKVGDIVKGKPKSDRRYSITNSKMIKGRVESVNNDTIRVRVLDHLDKTMISKAVYPVKSEYFELVNTETILIYRKNETVVAKNTATGEKAVAKCHPDDEFDFKIGARLAFDRLMSSEEPKKEEYYNGKVVCVDPGWAGVDLIMGKIYEVVDGYLIDDIGDKRPVCCEPSKSLDELNGHLSWELLEVVE